MDSDLFKKNQKVPGRNVEFSSRVSAFEWWQKWYFQTAL